MSRIRKYATRPLSNINLPIMCSWWIFCLALCLSTKSSSSAQETELFGPQLTDQNLYGSSADFVTEETTSRISAAKKINLIRYYLGEKVPGGRVAVVVDTSEIFYENIKRLWKLVATGEPIDRDVILLVYNDTDCSLLRTPKDGNRTATEVLDGIQASTTMSSGAGSILECVNLAMNMIDPYGSITLFTGRKAVDGMTLGESTGKEMTRNRKEFNCIWCSDLTGSTEEVKYYKKIAEKTNGHFLQFTKLEQDQISAANRIFDPRRALKADNYTESNIPSLEVDGTFQGTKIGGDETADLLYDPKISGYPEPRSLSSLENSAKIVTSKEVDGLKEAMELEDMQELASVTAIESAARLESSVVEVTAASSLVGTPGSTTRLTFTVTNNYPVTIRHYFQARSTTVSIVYLEPRNVWIESGQSANVVADVLVPTTATSSTVGTVTLVVQSVGSIEKTSYIYVRNTASTIYDTAKPGVSYSFNSNCAGKTGSGTCSNNLWSVDVTVQDGDSGLQRVTSSPTGIRATTNFISGSKSSTKFQYAATCCQTTVVITAEDLLGNSNSETIDVTIWWNLSQGEIAAVVLGTLFLLFILVIIILAIIFCIRRRKKSQDLPYTQRYGSRPPQARAERTSF